MIKLYVRYSRLSLTAAWVGKMRDCDPSDRHITEVPLKTRVSRINSC